MRAAGALRVAVLAARAAFATFALATRSATATTASVATTAAATGTAAARATAATAARRGLRRHLRVDARIRFVDDVGVRHHHARLALHGLEQCRVDGGTRDRLPDVRLDVGQRHRVELAGEADRVALRTEARRAADAVHVVLGVERQVEIEDVAHVLDMQAARGDVGRDEDLQLAALELREQLFALGLRHVAGEHADREVGALERARDLLAPHLGVDEHHRAVGVHAREQADEQRQLFLVRRQVDHLAHAVGRDVVGLDDELLRVVHVLVRELQHAVAERRREQQALALLARRHLAQQEADVLDEAEVEHAVGLVQHHDLRGTERDHVLLHVVDQAARRGDDHVGAGAQQLALLVVVHAAVDQREAQPGLARDAARVLLDLDRELARGRQHDGARVAGLAVGARGIREQAVQDRDEERERLAGAGLRLAGDVLVRERHRQRHRLDRRGAHEARLLEAGAQQRMQVEGVERDVGEGPRIGHDGFGDDDGRRSGLRAHRRRGRVGGSAAGFSTGHGSVSSMPPAAGTIRAGGGR